MKQALIQGTRICEFGTPFEVNPELKWVEVADNTTVQDTFVEGIVVKFVPSVTTMTDIRRERNELLVSSDFTQLDDSPKDKQAWKTYRQQLRDLPATTDDPADPTWPAAPE
jgi:hypothetical protein